jgi:hypothetical protein
MSILNVNQIQPVGSGQTVTISAANVAISTITVTTANISGGTISNVDSGVFTGNVGVQTNDITRSDLVGAGNSFVGMYIGDGFLAFSTSLNRAGGYYITTGINALNAGPVSLGSTMTLDGTWVIV